MSLSTVGLIPVLMLQVGHKSLRRPKPPLVYVGLRKDVGTPLPIKDVRTKQLVTLPLPKPSKPALAPSTPRARLPPQASLVITEAREVICAIAIQRATTEPRLLRGAHKPRACVDNAKTSPRAKVVIHEDMAPYGDVSV